MDVVIRADLRIHGGISQWEIQRLKVWQRRGGERMQEWKGIKFFPTLASAVRFIGEAELRDAHSVKDAAARLTRLENSLSALLDKVTATATDSRLRGRIGGQSHEGTG